MLGTLFTLPDSSTFLAAVGTTSAPIVSDFMPLIELVIGVGFAVFVVAWLVRLFTRHA
jgi:hypothetical protein